MILQGLDVAFKERIEAPKNSPRINKLKKIQIVVSPENQICSSPQLCQDSLHFASIHHSSFSMRNYYINPNSSTIHRQQYQREITNPCCSGAEIETFVVYLFIFLGFGFLRNGYGC